jgi:phosphoribosylformylglycinamidine synthase
VANLVRGLVNDGVVVGIHDVSEGGLALALAEMARESRVGAEIHGINDVGGLFTESPSRVVACAVPALVDDVLRRADAADVPATLLGEAGGDRLLIDPLVALSIDDLVGQPTLTGSSSA